MATDGQSYIALFNDSLGHAYAVRVDGTGQVLDFLAWIDFGEAGATQYEARAAFGGGHYLVTWSQTNADGTFGVRGRFLKADGTLEGTQSFPISTAEGVDSAVAWNGTAFVVAWVGFNTPSGADVRTALVGPNGVVPGSERQVSTSGSVDGPRVSAGANVSVVVWDDYGTGVGMARAARVEPDGTVLDPGGIALSSGEAGIDEVNVAAGGTGFLAVWRRHSAPYTIRGSVLDESGAIVAMDFPISRSELDSGLPSATFDGRSYLVAWVDGRDNNSVYGTRVSSAGAVLSDSDLKLATGSPRSPYDIDPTALAWNGSHFLLAFVGEGIQGSLIDSSLNLTVGSILLSARPNSQGSPRVTWNGQSYLITWIDERDPSWDLFTVHATRISTAGRVLDSDGLLVSGDSTAFSHDSASAARGTALVLWADTNGRLWRGSVGTADGAGAVFAVTDNFQGSPPSLASNNGTYLTVFTLRSGSELDARFLAADGTPGPVFSLPVSPEAGRSGPTVMAAGQGYLVSYSNAGTWLVPVSSSDQVGTPLQLSPNYSSVRSATDGSGTLIVWSSYSDPRILGRFYANGAFQGDAFVISPASSGMGCGAVAWDGANYLAVWETTYDSPRPSARLIAPSGLLDEAVVLVDDECASPQLASNGAGQLLLACYKYTGPYYSRRIVTRLIGAPVVPPVPDAGTADAGTGDAGSVEDAGTLPDSSAADAGAPDTGAPDTGAPDTGAPDTGAPDAGSDGGADSGADAGQGGFVIRCALASSHDDGGGTAAALAAAAVALVLSLRRRRDQ